MASGHVRWPPRCVVCGKQATATAVARRYGYLGTQFRLPAVMWVSGNVMRLRYPVCSTHRISHAVPSLLAGSWTAAIVAGAAIVFSFEWLTRTQLGIQDRDVRVAIGLMVALLLYLFARRLNPVDLWDSHNSWLTLSFGDRHYSADFEDLNREIIGR